MTEEQSMLVDWLLSRLNSYLLPPGELKKSAASGSLSTPRAITTHGAVILTPEGKPDEEWKAHMLGQLAPYRGKADIDAASDH
ncbi:hypothetical protein IE994_23745 [Enterobacter hormaechei]|nr:hypothetical protein [Enterobacter hormaechei]